MAAWFEQDMRLDIAIAVSLEVAALRMNRAETPAERASAISFNRRLWYVAAALAPSAPVLEDRNGLIETAELVTSGALGSDETAALNIAFSRRLAGRAATGGALRQILADWRAFRAFSPRAEFGLWLVERMETFLQPELARAA